MQNPENKVMKMPNMIIAIVLGPLEDFSMWIIKIMNKTITRSANNKVQIEHFLE